MGCVEANLPANFRSSSTHGMLTDGITRQKKQAMESTTQITNTLERLGDWMTDIFSLLYTYFRDGH